MLVVMTRGLAILLSGTSAIGSIEVVVEAAGYVAIEREYEVGSDECEHAATEHDRLELTPEE